MGIPVTQFEELNGLIESDDELNDRSSQDDGEWSKEEIQLRKEEVEDNEDDDW